MDEMGPATACIIGLYQVKRPLAADIFIIQAKTQKGNTHPHYLGSLMERIRSKRPLLSKKCRRFRSNRVGSATREGWIGIEPVHPKRLYSDKVNLLFFAGIHPTVI